MRWFLRSREHAGRRPRPSRPAGVRAGQRFERLDGCTLAESDGNDGDSFRVRHPGGAATFRLYWVDTCETRLNFPERIRHQARYFGIPTGAVPHWGKVAREFSVGRLTGRRFTVHTRWEPVMESDRFHAFIEIDRMWLCELLVREGLARIFTMPSDAPDGTSEAAFGRRLREAESEARRAGRGAWSGGKP